MIGSVRIVFAGIMFGLAVVPAAADDPPMLNTVCRKKLTVDFNGGNQSSNKRAVKTAALQGVRPDGGHVVRNRVPDRPPH